MKLAPEFVARVLAHTGQRISAQVLCRALMDHTDFGVNRRDAQIGIQRAIESQHIKLNDDWSLSCASPQPYLNAPPKHRKGRITPGVIGHD